MISKYKILRTRKQVLRLIEYCKMTKHASIDFETKAEGPQGKMTGGDDKMPTGPQYEEDEPTGLGISFQPGSAFFIPLFHFESPFSRVEAKKLLKLIGREIIGNPDIVKIAWNFKFEYRWFLRYGIHPRGILLDGMLCKYLLDEEKPFGLKDFVANHIPDFANYEDEIDELRKKYRYWSAIPLQPLAKYCCIDCDVTLRATLLLEQSCIKKGFYPLLRNMCMMQMRTLAESESMGMLVDREYLEATVKRQGKEIELNEQNLLQRKVIRKFQRWRVKQHIKKLIEQVQSEIIDLQEESDKTGKDVRRQIANREEKISRYIAGNLVTKKEVVGEFNFNSPNQLVDLFFNSPAGFKFKVVKFTKDDRKQDTDRPSTDEEVLLALAKKDKTGFMTGLLKHREMQKLYSTYMVAPLYRLTKYNTLHCSYLIHGTVTGRLSSKNINMQNIPRDTTSSLIKRMFIPPPGHLLLEVDYGQAELRVVAELAGCKALIDIFNNNYNVHLATGCKIMNAMDKYEEAKKILKMDDHPDKLFWEKQKKKGKVLNFSILYLQSDEMTADQMGVKVHEAAEFKEAWFKAFPEIRRWMKGQEKFLRINGFVYNMFGRKRRLPDIYEMNKGSQNKAIRDCINAPIQGASSDFTQLSTIIIRERIKQGLLKLSDDPAWQAQAYTVHDSIGFYIMPQYIHEAAKQITEICSDPETEKYFGFKMQKVKMKVSPEIGINWGKLLDYNPEEDYSKLLAA